MNFSTSPRSICSFPKEWGKDELAGIDWAMISIILGNKITLSALHLVGRYMSFGQITHYSPSSFIFLSPQGEDPKNTVKGVGGGRDSFQLHRYYLFYWEVFKNEKFHRKAGEVVTSTNLKLAGFEGCYINLLHNGASACLVCLDLDSTQLSRGWIWKESDLKISKLMTSEQPQ